MDSLTQLTLGAAVGEAVLGRRAGRKAAAWGAVCGTLPDLDTLYPFADAVAAFTWHRGYSHSLLVLCLLAPLLAWLVIKIHPQERARRHRWLLLVLLALLTHILLDCFTVYGTQIFLPFSDWPVAWSAVFIIDPFYTVPLAAGVLCAVFLRNRRRWNLAGLTLSAVYLIAALAVKAQVDAAAEHNIAAQNIAATKTLTTPAPFNIALWRVLAMEDGGYREGFYSLLDGAGEIRFTRHASDDRLLGGAGGEAFARLRWFSRGFYKVWRAGGRIIFSDLRMGMLETYVFNFALARATAAGPVAVAAEPVAPPETPDGFFPWLARRIFDRGAAPPRR